MLGVLINVCTVIAGSTVGLLFKKSISKKYSDAVMTGIGLCVILIGIQGMLKGENVLITIVSMVIGALIGTALDIDGKLNGAGDWLSKKIRTGDSGKSSLAEGFVTASLVFCIGAMTILGSLDAGLKGDNTTLITKSILDLFSSMMLSASLGIGVIFAAAFVGAWCSGKELYESAVIASEFTVECIRRTYENPAHWYGVKFEPCLGTLIDMLK